MPNKIALCFIINYEHVLYKEELWRKWIEHNKDIINVYFFYKDIRQIKSKWIYDHAIPQSNVRNTTYYHVIPAYLTLLKYALLNDKHNKWFCFLTDSCCPIISPGKFRQIFEANYNKSIIRHSIAHWNIQFHRRANLELIPKEYHLCNDPWFILTRENAIDCINYAVNEYKMCNLICQGGLANESLFAILLKYYNKLDRVISEVTHITDWANPSSPTSPHMFKDGSLEEIKIIEEALKNNKYAMFIRKIHPKFPNEILESFIYFENKDDNQICGIIILASNILYFSIGLLIGFGLLLVLFSQFFDSFFY
uniref:Glycosyltransferase n=1 Tax=viral metagenome TaxID=1070528 RepID=A0A6C0DHF8_9ZZZZ